MAQSSSREMGQNSEHACSFGTLRTAATFCLPREGAACPLRCVRSPLLSTSQKENVPVDFLPQNFLISTFTLCFKKVL